MKKLTEAQQRRKFLDKCHSERFDPAKDKYVDTLAKAIKEEQYRHRSLLKIAEITPEQVSSPTLLQDADLDEYTQILWDFNGNDKTAYFKKQGTGKALLGGVTNFLLGPNNEQRTVAFIWMAKNGTDEVEAIIKLGLLYHEMGHVDDFEKGINIIADGEYDICESELYAHHYACRQLRAKNHRAVMSWYLGGLIENLLNSNICLVQRVAKQFVASPAYREYFAFSIPDLFVEFRDAFAVTEDSVH